MIYLPTIFEKNCDICQKKKVIIELKRRFLFSYINSVTRSLPGAVVKRFLGMIDSYVFLVSQYDQLRETVMKEKCGNYSEPCQRRNLNFFRSTNHNLFMN